MWSYKTGLLIIGPARPSPLKSLGQNVPARPCSLEISRPGPKKSGPARPGPPFQAQDLRPCYKNAAW